MSTQYSHPDVYPQYSQQYSQQYPQQYSGQQSTYYENSSYDQSSFDNVNNYYDDPQNVHSTSYVPVVNSSPVLPTSYTAPFSDQCAPMNSGNSYSAPAPMVENSSGHMVAYAPNPAMEMPQEDVPQYGNRHRAEIPPGQSWARPSAHPQYSEPAMSHSNGDERRGSLSQQSVKSESEWDQDYEANAGYYEPAHDNSTHANAVQHHAVSHTHSHSHEFNGYQQPQGQYSFPQQAEHPQQPEHQPSFGMYSPRRHPQDQQLAQDAPYDSYSEQWNGEGGVPECALGLQREEYGVLPAHQPEHEQYQTSAPMSYNAPAPNTYVQNQVQHPHDNARYAPNSQSPSSQQSLSYPSESSPVIQSSSPQSTFAQTASQVGPIRHNLFAQQHQAREYQKTLEAKHNNKRQLAFQLGDFESNQRRRLSDFSGDQTPTYAPVHSPRHQHHHQHQPQASTSSFSGQPHTSHRPIAPPIVPSQAHERSSPLTHGTDPEEKKDTPPKKPALACLFCRKRKIACGPPPPDSLDRTCNQCQRRKQFCEYPTESRRGIRKTPKEAVPEEPTVHKFVHGDASLHDGSVAGRGRGRRKRASE